MDAGHGIGLHQPMSISIHKVIFHTYYINISKLLTAELRHQSMIQSHYSGENSSINLSLTQFIVEKLNFFASSKTKFNFQATTF